MLRLGQATLAMDKSSHRAEDVFAEAIELPPGRKREEFVASRCGHDSPLQNEVMSLLRAHDAASDFLMPGTRQQPTLQTTVMNAASRADVFLRAFTDPSHAQIEDFVAQLAEPLRKEAREEEHADDLSDLLSMQT